MHRTSHFQRQVDGGVAAGSRCKHILCDIDFLRLHTTRVDDLAAKQIPRVRLDGCRILHRCRQGEQQVKRHRAIRLHDVGVILGTVSGCDGLAAEEVVHVTTQCHRILCIDGVQRDCTQQRQQGYC